MPQKATRTRKYSDTTFNVPKNLLFKMDLTEKTPVLKTYSKE